MNVILTIMIETMMNNRNFIFSLESYHTEYYTFLFARNNIEFIAKDEFI